MKILDINEPDATFSLFFYMNIEYFDGNIEFMYLHDNHRNNQIEDINAEVSEDNHGTRHQNILNPNVTFLFLDDNQHVISEEYFGVKKLGKPRMKSNHEQYRGSENPLVKETLNQAVFKCSFSNTVNYPFGDEVCSFKISLSKTLGKFEAGNITYQGGHEIGQYVVFGHSWSLSCNKSDNIRIKDCADCPDIQSCTVSVELKRDVMSILIQSFLPSLLLNIINQASVYLKGNLKSQIVTSSTV